MLISCCLDMRDSRIQILNSSLQNPHLFGSWILGIDSKYFKASFSKMPLNLASPHHHVHEHIHASRVHSKVYIYVRTRDPVGRGGAGKEMDARVDGERTRRWMDKVRAKLSSTSENGEKSLVIQCREDSRIARIFLSRFFICSRESTPFGCPQIFISNFGIK